MQVNIAARKAAISPGSIDDELSFKGTYTTFLLPEREGLPAIQSVELKIAASAGQPQSMCIQTDAYL